MLDRIAHFIARHKMFPRASRVAIAVSGGADSVFLLHALQGLAPLWNLELSIVHVEHGIRGPESVADAKFVRQLAASFSLPFHIHNANVPAIPGNQEQAARRVRQQVFMGLIAAGAVDRIATGHTRSDQAETVLYRILRGSGLAGLSGIYPVTKEGMVRPLLEISRAEIEVWLNERSIAWREDDTNQNLSYARNRLRHEILPLLRESCNPRLEETLSNMATMARDEELYWQSILPPATSQQSPATILAASHLTTVPTAVARRLIRRAIAAAKGDLRQIEFGHVERILELARSTNGHGRIHLPGLQVVRSFDWIQISPGTRPVLDYSMILTPPGSVELPGSDARITLQVLEKTKSKPCATVGDELDWQRFVPVDGVLPSLELRNWRPGDQYQPAGQSKPQKVKFLFQQARIPLWERRNWPIITYNGTIVWTRRFGAAAEFAAGPSTRVVLRVEESPDKNDPGNLPSIS